MAFCFPFGNVYFIIYTDIFVAFHSLQSVMPHMSLLLHSPVMGRKLGPTLVISQITHVELDRTGNLTQDFQLQV